MGQTKIEWTDKTWNPITGCTPISPGCAHCYAKRMAKRLAGRCGYPEAPHEFDVTLHPEKLDEPLHWRKPTRVFVCSMSDLFHNDVPLDFVDDVFWQMEANAPQHTYQVLTKRPERMLEFYKERCLAIMSGEHIPAPNIWLGVTVENQEQADERIPILLHIPAAVRFVSIEPMLGPVDLTRIKDGSADVEALLGERRMAPFCYSDNGQHLNWVIVGGETGPGARPMHPQWVRDIRDQCQEVGVSFFFKGWGSNPHPSAFDSIPMINAQMQVKNGGRLLDGREWNEYPKGV